jgi:lipopolysaccharide biosynthesis regulator YciM
LAQAGQREHAEATIAQIKDADMRESALSDLGRALAQVGQWEHAEATILQIKDADMRGRALNRLINALSKTKNYERSLAVVQHSWLQATTRIEALNLLQIVNPFILLKPELSVALVEAFPWVDNFLKG